jgi:hypothetical protein
VDWEALEKRDQVETLVWNVMQARDAAEVESLLRGQP